MKCSACGQSFPLSRWRAVNLDAMTKTTVNTNSNRNGKAVSYYSLGGHKTNQYNIIYACPHCGTLRIKTPIDKT